MAEPFTVRRFVHEPIQLPTGSTADSATDDNDGARTVRGRNVTTSANAGDCVLIGGGRWCDSKHAGDDGDPHRRIGVVTGLLDVRGVGRVAETDLT